MKTLAVALSILLTACAQVPQKCDPARDKNGRIARSSAAVRQFKATHICPGTGKIETSCYGYVVDHVKPLACCGADHPSNMQYQSIKEAREKDKWERKTCGEDD